MFNHLQAPPYPEAYRIFRAHCRSYLSTPQVKPTNTDDATQSRTLKLPEGTTLVIPPQEKDYTSSGRKKHWIVCLFTSWHYGQRRSSPDVILENTVLAVEDFKRQLGQFKESAEGEDKGSERPGELWGCRFNAGLFGVPWEKTKGVLEEAGLEMTIVRPKEN
ncbi:hypothetical protein AJ80_09578 [Polytolypa hystricis UAMH7299]|uniref:ADP-ribose 1''-phosphate phosphatase n=1 Tax=Polytolypa hystricis (strain UAMH7299) TaxID=1447883 RepID=A0A2B7WNV5_POLH7|nr:hypothetical protein AJ80_09578 [Polytolypa hystricis UAMH7299]